MSGEPATNRTQALGSVEGSYAVLDQTASRQQVTASTSGRGGAVTLSLDSARTVQVEKAQVTN